MTGNDSRLRPRRSNIFFTSTTFRIGIFRCSQPIYDTVSLIFVNSLKIKCLHSRMHTHTHTLVHCLFIVLVNAFYIIWKITWDVLKHLINFTLMTCYSFFCVNYLFFDCRSSMVIWCNRFMSFGVTSIFHKNLILYEKVNMDET